MAANRLLFSDDFSGYTSDAEVAAVYPHPSGGSGYDSPSTDWGGDYGPDGQPGIKDQVSGAARDTGMLEKHFLEPQCHGFKVKGRWNFAATNALLTGHSFVSVEWHLGEDDWASVIRLSRGHVDEELRIFIRTLPTHGNVLSGTAWFLAIPNVLLDDTPTTVEVSGVRSTIQEPSPGVFSPDADGEVNVLINDAVVASFTGPVWNGRSDINPAPYWNAVVISTIGAFSDLEVWDETGCVVDVGGDISLCPPCVTPDPGTVDSGGGQGAGASPWIQPAIGQQLVCAGGGLVPTQADAVPSELWWGL